jgi:hypothetical protein
MKGHVVSFQLVPNLINTLSSNQFYTIHSLISWFCICGAPKKKFESSFSLVVLNKVVDVLNAKKKVSLFEVQVFIGITIYILKLKFFIVNNLNIIFKVKALLNIFSR